MTDTAIIGTATEKVMATGREEERGLREENVTVIAETTDVANSAVNLMTAGSVVTIMIVARITAKRTAGIGTVEVVRRDLRVVVGVRGGMGLALQSGGPLHPRVHFLWPSGGAKPLDGMFMLRDTNNIQPCKQNRQVFSIFLERTAHKFLPSSALLVYHLQSQSRRLEWESGATRTCLGSLVASTLAVSHLKLMSRILPTSSTAR